MAANSSGASLFAPHPTIAGLYVGLTDSTSTIGIDPITLCIFRGVSPDTTANTYHHGCIAIVVDGSGGSSSMYQNTGTYAAPSWSVMTAGSGVTTYAVVAATTNGTTPVNLFGTTNGITGTLTSVIAIAQDTTASNISLITNVGGTETKFADKIVKSTSIGGVTGTITSNTAFTAAGTTQIVSSGSGNAVVVATYTTY